jgi:hypothetical protein
MQLHPVLGFCRESPNNGLHVPNDHLAYGFVAKFGVMQPMAEASDSISDIKQLWILARHDRPSICWHAVPKQLLQRIDRALELLL